MPGHMLKVGTNKWRFCFESERVDKKRKRHYKTFTGSKPEARAEFAKLLAEFEKGTYLISSKLTFGDYLVNWLENYGKTRLAPTTFTRYSKIINLRVIPKLGSIPLTKLRPLHLQGFYKQLVEEGRLDGRPGQLSHASIIYHHRVVHKALDSAVKQQLISFNPADAVELPKPAQEIDDPDIKEHVKFLDSNQVDIMLERLKGHQFYEAVFVDVRTGLRRGELLALRKQDIDLKNGKLTVKQSLAYTPGKGTFFKVPKTKKSRRTIDISKEVVDVLKQQIKKQAALKLQYGSAYEDKGLIFSQPNGRPLHPDTLSSWFPSFLRNIGLPELNFHCLRHTFASLMLQAEVEIKIISEMMGHSSVRITYDLYSHLMPGMQKDAVNKLERLLKK